jgi:hypothetical protein
MTMDDEEHPFLFGIFLGMALFLFAPIAAMMFFSPKVVLATFLGIGLDLLFALFFFLV